MKYDYLIVGSGLFGATFAYRAKQMGKKCLVIDKRSHLGGNVYCENVDGSTGSPTVMDGPNTIHVHNNDMRDPAFDIMKGIGIIAMIIGHCVIPYPLYIFIFAWHMPMFFIVSGYFFRTKPIMDNFKRLMKQILVPYMVTACICVAAKLGCQTSLESHDYMTPVLSLINGAGSKDVAMFGEYTIGAIWFLLAMFWCRFIYNALSLKVTNNIVMGGGNSTSFYYSCGF